MAQAIMPDVLSDEEMSKLEAGNMPETLTDADMEKLSPTQQPTEKPKQHGLLGALMPSRMQAEDKGKSGISKGIADVSDVLTLIPRTVAGISAGAGTLAGGGTLGEAARADLGEMSRTSINPNAKQGGVVGFAQNLAYDPATYLPAGKLFEGTKILAKAPSLVKGAVKAGVQGAEQGALSGAAQSVKNGEVNPLEVAGQAGAGAVMGGGLGALGQGLEGLGKTALGAEMKITKPVARAAYGADLAEKKQNIINDLVKFHLSHFLLFSIMEYYFSTS
jgi:hypothetical protein